MKGCGFAAPICFGFETRYMLPLLGTMAEGTRSAKAGKECEQSIMCAKGTIMLIVFAIVGVVAGVVKAGLGEGGGVEKVVGGAVGGVTAVIICGAVGVVQRKRRGRQ